MNRAAFLATVRQATHSGRKYALDITAPPAEMGYVGVQGDLCDALAAEVRGVGGQPVVVSDRLAAGAAVQGLLHKYQPRTALCWDHPLLEQIQAEKLLSELGITVVRYQHLERLAEAARRETIMSADVGLSSVDWAIAETGTLVVCARPGQERVTSLVPRVHVAVVAADQILPDLFDLFARLTAGPDPVLPANLALITGPSKTGDIELELTTGIHGPGEWHVVIVRDRM